MHVGHAQNPWQRQLQPTRILVVRAVDRLQQAALERLEDVLLLWELEKRLQTSQALCVQHMCILCC